MPLDQIAFDFDDSTVVPQQAVAAPVVEKPEPKPVKDNNRKRTRGRMALKNMDSGADLIEIPEDEQLFQKMYYSMSEVAGMFKVNQSLIRFWENEFDILKPRKNGKGDRLFRPEDVKNQIGRAHV